MNAKNSDFGTFGQDVLLGLQSNPKTLSSKYFYDATGDKLFQEIMALPEYYLTRKEFEILEQQHQQILKSVLESSEPFNLVELGAGDGLKTKILLRYLQSQNVTFSYFPIDFSGSVLAELKESLSQEMPELEVKTIENTYRGAMKEKAWENGRKSLILFMGSNLGNFQLKEAYEILDHIRIGTNHSDYVMIGFDLKKSPQIILDAYNDKTGVTKAFNLNLLHRINQELGANFDLESFVHWPTYDPILGECRSYLVSLKVQKVYFEAMDETIHFDAYEPIFMEVSKKYSLREIDNLAERSGFKVIENFTDRESYFADCLWQKK